MCKHLMVGRLLVSAGEPLLPRKYGEAMTMRLLTGKIHPISSLGSLTES